MPKQRTPGRSNKHVRTVKRLIAVFAISATVAGCAALNTQSGMQPIFAPAITIDIDDLGTQNSIDTLRLTVNTATVHDDDDTPAQQPSQSLLHAR